MHRAVELFVGAGGLGLGVAQAGFKHEAALEWNKVACDTIKFNQRRGVKLVKDWGVHQVDVSKFDYGSIKSNVDLLAGGPPCQPFSMGGKHLGRNDERNMFPEVFRAIRELTPKAILIENVKGLTRRSFATYLNYIILQVRHPEIKRRLGEEWGDHLSRLERHHTGGKYKGLQYNVVWRLINAARYGVPQKRERVFIVAFRSDLNLEWSFPNETHSMDALHRDQWISGAYWDKHRIPTARRPKLTVRIERRVNRLKQDLAAITGKPCMTVRDALKTLPAPGNGRSAPGFLGHKFIPGAKSYPGHTGSPYDEPAKTLKAGVHGVPGGENMLAFADGSVRYFTVRETARLQTFPDEYAFDGAWGEAMRQLGNAVPVKLASQFAEEIKAKLEGLEIAGRSR